MVADTVTFEEEFPSLREQKVYVKKKHCNPEKGIGDYAMYSEPVIQRFCFSKQRVKEILEEHRSVRNSVGLIPSGPDYIDLLLKELGL